MCKQIKRGEGLGDGGGRREKEGEVADLVACPLCACTTSLSILKAHYWTC